MTMNSMTRILMPAIAALLLGQTPASAQEAKAIRLGFTMGEASNQGRAAKFFADTVAEMSGGSLRVRPVGGARLGQEAQTLASLEMGKQEMALVSTTALIPVAPSMALWDAPFLFDTEREADAVLDGAPGSRVLAQVGSSGAVGLVYWEFGFREMTNCRRDVRTREDMHDLKLRVPTSLSPGFAALGATPVSIPFPKLYEALQTKTVDGQEHPVSVIFNAKLYEVQDHLTLSRHAYAAWVLLAGKRWWDSLSGAEREIVMAAARASRDFERADTRAEAALMLAGLKEKGMRVHVLDPAKRDEMRDTLRPVRAALSVQVGQDLWQQVQADIARVRREK
jgi:tripartite ATP-independent transporter DctP family solute receptor